MTRILGIDPGTRATGYGVVEVEGNRLRYISHGVITTGAASPLPLRLEKIFAELGEIIETYNPHEVAVENLFQSRNHQSALKLGHARGVILLCAQLEKKPITEYTPAQVKSAVVGYGRATKEQVQQMVKRLLSLPKIPPSDAADALGVAICHSQSRTAVRAVESAIARSLSAKGRTR